MLTIIAAVAANNVIGRENKIPWNIPEDLKRFQKLTKGKFVLMGRKTYESIIAYLGKPLPERKSIVITRQKNYKVPEGVEVFENIEEALNKYKNQTLFIIGGAEIYKQTLPLAQKLFITEIHKNIEGDAHFPEINKTIWQEISREDHKDFSFVEYERRLL